MKIRRQSKHVYHKITRIVIILLSLFIYTQAVFAQSSQEDVFTVAEKMPEFPGGQTAMQNFITKTMKYPTEVFENNIQGRVICIFTVSKAGKITDISILKSVNPYLDKEAIRIIESMPNWTPGSQNGNAVNVRYTVPIMFSSENILLEQQSSFANNTQDPSNSFLEQKLTATELNRLGDYYCYGWNNTPINYSMALTYYKESEQMGNGGGMYRIGRCYYNGQGVEQNIDIAITYLKRAIDNGDTDAMVLLGDYNRALRYKQQREWERNSTMMAYTDPYAALTMVMNGFYEHIDNTLSSTSDEYHEINLYSKAAAMGNKLAMQRIRENQIEVQINTAEANRMEQETTAELNRIDRDIERIERQGAYQQMNRTMGYYSSSKTDANNAYRQHEEAVRQGNTTKANEEYQKYLRCNRQADNWKKQSNSFKIEYERFR